MTMTRIKTIVKKHTVQLICMCAALLALGAGCTSAEQAARDAALKTKAAGGEKAASSAADQLCQLGAKGRAVALEEAKKLKAGEAAGALRATLTEALLCGWTASRDPMSDKVLDADNALIEALGELYKGEPDAKQRVAILEAWNKTLFPLSATYLVAYPLLGVALPTLKTPEDRKPLGTMLTGPYFGGIPEEKRAALDLQRAGWCEHVGAHIPATIDPKTQLWAGDYAVSGDVQMQLMNLTQHGCAARTKPMFTATWDEIDRRLDPVYAAEKKAQLDAGKPEAVAARFANQALMGMSMGVSQAARDALVWPKTFKTDQPYKPEQRLGAVVSRARLSALTQWIWVAAAGQRDPKHAAEIVNLYLEKPRSCLTLDQLFGVAFGDVTQGRETLLASREDAKNRVWLYADRCPAAFIALSADGWKWFGAERHKAFKEKMDAAHKQAGLNPPVLRNP